MKGTFKSLAIFAAFTLLLTSCKKDKGSSTVSYKAKTGNRAAVVNRMMAGNITWTSGTAYAVKIEFEAEMNDNSQTELEAAVNRKIDLFASITELANITIPEGKYDEIETEIELAPSASDTAFVLRGTFTNGASQTTPVLFFINQQLELKDEADNVTINGGDKKYTALTDFNLSLLTQGITEAMLNSATRTGGVIIISSGSNSSIYSAMLSAIHNMDTVELDD